MDSFKKYFGNIPDTSDVVPVKSTYTNGDVEYFDPTTRKLHRTDGPAVEYSNGEKRWYNNGLRHRIGGPAVILKSGKGSYWINGESCSKEEHDKVVKLIKTVKQGSKEADLNLDI